MAARKVVEEKTHYQPSILDACCGGRMFHFDKSDPDILFMDIRSGDFSVKSKKVLVDPDVVADFRNIPFEDESFNMVIFDPPHLKWAGAESYMRAMYGELDVDTWRADIKSGFDECWRVLRFNGTLVFKWSESQIKLNEVLELAPCQPICGTRTSGKTHFLVFFKMRKLS